jgi:oligopeptide/dipeptide ABC transporter ATP-binding protein
MNDPTNDRTGEILLEVRDLRTHFFTGAGVVRAVDGVSFSLEKGKALGIVGESGSGKSVTSDSIMRLLPNNGRIVGGSILFEGQDLAKLQEKSMLKIRGQEISMIFQDPMTSLDPVFRIGDQITEMLRTHRSISKSEAREEAVRALALVGIPEPEKRMDSYPHEFSGGMRQRVFIAMAIVCRPKLIIADEPTTALDVTVQAQVLDLLADLRRKLGTSIILVTHNLGVVWSLCDTAMVMYAGKTVEFATTKNLYRNPLHPYTWGLLNSMPKLSDGTDTGLRSRKPLASIPGTPPDLRLTARNCNFHNRCAYCKDICKERVPPLVELEPGHWAACHLQGTGNRLERLEELGGPNLC